MTNALTSREKQTLDFIRDYIEEAGYPPTLVEIAKALETTAVSTAHRMVWKLHEKGYIKRPVANSSRAITIIREAS